MMFQKKLDRAMKWLENKNKDEDWEKDSVELEKNDWLAIIISALIVFGPIILILFMIIFYLL